MFSCIFRIDRFTLCMVYIIISNTDESIGISLTLLTKYLIEWKRVDFILITFKTFLLNLDNQYKAHVYDEIFNILYMIISFYIPLSTSILDFTFLILLFYLIISFQYPLMSKDRVKIKCLCFYLSREWYWQQRSTYSNSQT